MHYEVEQKHPVADVDRFLAELAARGITLGQVELHVDTYYNHPSRDFAQTDEALRIRRIGDTNCITYKGPKIDKTTKTRRELELPIPAGSESAAQFAELLTVLGFTRVAAVAKSRRSFSIDFNDRSVTGTLDEVDGVGTFAELEITTDENGLEAAKQVVVSLAEDLKLGPSERRSYLEMSLTK
jgi:adenylate cyclase class 2